MYLSREDIYVTLKSPHHITCFSGEFGKGDSRPATLVQCSLTLLTPVLTLLMPALSKGWAEFFSTLTWPCDAAS